MQEVLICYDIANPRRLGRVHRFLKRHACPVQYSVFLFTGTSCQLEHCLSQLGKLMEPKEDDVRAYPLPQRGYRLSMGTSTLPEGIHWAGLPPAWQQHESATTTRMPDNDASSVFAII